MALHQARACRSRLRPTSPIEACEVCRMLAIAQTSGKTVLAVFAVFRGRAELALRKMRRPPREPQGEA